MGEPEKNWKLGDDLSEYDNLLDCPVVDLKAIKRTVHDIIDGRLEDMWFLVENNAAKIAAEATKYRGK